jgi:3-(3-hydroxy-phenyl)propionate hydroxylase
VSAATQDSEQLSADVVVIGLGPVGTALSGLLGRRGITVVGLDRSTEVFALPRAAHIDHTGLRVVQELGCLDEILDGTITNPGIDFIGADGDLIMHQPANVSTRSGLPASVYFHQPAFDTTLRAAAQAQDGVDLRLGVEAEAVEVLGDRVRVRTRELATSRTVDISASYVVACDGATSPIREALGIELEDLGFHERWLVLDLILAERSVDLPRHAVYHCRPDRPYMTIPMPGRRHRVECQLRPDEDPAQMQEPDVVRALLEGLIGTGDMLVERAAVYTFHGLLARQWRRGRVLLAGDAAHQMPPFLGQGMCSGFRDAVNLAWKLHLIVRNGAPEALLDTYQEERSPHVRMIVERAIEFGKLVAVRDAREAAERDNRLRRDHSGLLFSLPDLDAGTLIGEGGGRQFGQPWVNGQRLDDVVGPHFLVLADGARPLRESAQWWRDELDAVILKVDELREPDPSLVERFDKRKDAVLVLRPDRYILTMTDDLDAVSGSVAPLLAGNSARPFDTVATAVSEGSGS